MYAFRQFFNQVSPCEDLKWIIRSEEYRNYAIKHTLFNWLLNIGLRKFTHHNTFYSLLTLNVVPPSNKKSNTIYKILLRVIFIFLI